MDTYTMPERTESGKYGTAKSGVIKGLYAEQISGFFIAILCSIFYRLPKTNKNRRLFQNFSFGTAIFKKTQFCKALA
jgi:hypothetical protein